MSGGIQDGVGAIAEQIQLTPEEAAARAAAADKAERERADDGNFGGLFFIGFIILIFFIIPWLSSRSGPGNKWLRGGPGGAEIGRAWMRATMGDVGGGTGVGGAL